LVLDGVGGHVDGADVVAIDQSRGEEEHEARGAAVGAT
jgi:hypothetical protein